MQSVIDDINDLDDIQDEFSIAKKIYEHTLRGDEFKTKSGQVEGRSLH